jgi:hypothetical protein
MAGVSVCSILATYSEKCAELGLETRVGNKKPTQKNPKKNHLKKPIKNVFFLVFLNFLFFMKMRQTFPFETDFL